MPYSQISLAHHCMMISSALNTNGMYTKAIGILVQPRASWIPTSTLSVFEPSVYQTVSTFGGSFLHFSLSAISFGLDMYNLQTYPKFGLFEVLYKAVRSVSLGYGRMPLHTHEDC